MEYISTRGLGAVSGSRAILDGIAADGGLYVPVSFPVLTAEDFEVLSGQDYPERAAYILNKYLPEFSREELLVYAEKAYGRFDSDPCPVVKIDDETYILELFHGPTLAFKDMALTLLPYLMTASKRVQNEKRDTHILVATSGDTGKAALEGFRDVEGTKITVFYPDGGVSPIQRKQMVTQEGGNVKVVGIKGNFDDAQSAVKSIFAKHKGGTETETLSSANSINWGRLAPQIVYYISAYIDLLASDEIKNGEEINFVVPTGNFGNILAAYYAKKMGLPIGKLIVASNKNNVLTEFFKEGIYDINRRFFKTISPSMDILVSSNLERLLFEMVGRDSGRLSTLMAELSRYGKYDLQEEDFKDADCFKAYFSDDDETEYAIGNFFDMFDYLLDPHTGVAIDCYYKYIQETDDNTKTVVVSTANPFKFPGDVLRAVASTRVDDAFIATKKLASFAGMEIPSQIAELKTKPERFDTVIGKNEIEDYKL